jgi:aspartokinase/homoserine dehydrogenase 1
VNSGDKVTKIEAVLSGTLNYILNELGPDRFLSEVVKEAKEKGYSEPDPRDDLSGEDVVRKILILVREAGIKIEREDLETEPFVPQSYFNASSAEEFIEKLGDLDASYERRRSNLADKNRKLRYVATYESGKAKVGFKTVDVNDPMYELDETNNIVLLYSDYYKKQPLVIRGYGAGTDVTSAGIFADIIRVANI